MYNSYSGYDSSLEALAGMSTVSMLLSIAFVVFQIICRWRILEKAGEGGWKILIPVYGTIVWYKVCWKAKYFIILTIVIIAALLLMLILIPTLGSDNPEAALGGIGGIALFIIIPLAIVLVVMSIIACVKLAHRFGKSTGFAVGLIFLSPIFEAILAFDGSNYDIRRTDPGYVGPAAYTQNSYQDDFNAGSTDW